MSTKGESSKKLVKEKETKTEIVDMDKDSSKGKKKTVAVTEVAEVTEPLEVLEAEEVETAKPPDEGSAGEIREELRELRPKEGEEIIVGPSRLTRFEKARIIGARALQLSLGAPTLISTKEGLRNSITVAEAELMEKALPVSLRRILPNGQYQDIPISWLLKN